MNLYFIRNESWDEDDSYYLVRATSTISAAKEFADQNNLQGATLIVYPAKEFSRFSVTHRIERVITEES